MPSLDLNGSFRDDDLGTGQLLSQLGNALLTAQIEGTVTQTNGNPIQTLADLTTDCAQGGGGGGGGGSIELAMRADFGEAENLNVDQDPANVL